MMQWMRAKRCLRRLIKWMPPVVGAYLVSFVVFFLANATVREGPGGYVYRYPDRLHRNAFIQVVYAPAHMALESPVYPVRHMRWT